MKLTEVIVRRPVAAIIIILAIVVFGFMSLVGMDQESTPEMDLPYMLVMVSYPNVGPEDVDKLVTQRVEGAVGTLSGLKSIMSFSNEGSSTVLLEFEYGTDMDSTYIDLKEALDRITYALPDNANDPMVFQMNMNAQASVSLSVHSESIDDLLYYVEEELQPEFEKLSSVSEVSISGGKNEYIRVELLEDKMVQYGLTMSSIAGSVGTADFTQPSGEINFGSQSWNLTSSVQYRSAEELRNLPITLSNGSMVRLEDVANVYYAEDDATSISRYNGEETINVSITKRQSSTAVAVSRQVRDVIDQIHASDMDVTIEIIDDESETIQESLWSVGETLILGVIISMIILFLFLGDVKASLIVGSSMPVSLLVTFVCMSFMGFTLNIITMGALVLGVGMMVDNSIVVLDSCFKHAKERTFAEAAVEGTKFVFMSVAAGTATTMVVFLPLTTIEGLVGEMFRPLGYTIAFALMASLFSAVTLVPLFFVRYRPEEKKNAPAAMLLKKIERFYVKFLKMILIKKKTAFVVSLALVVVALFIASGLDMELMSATDEGTISISIETRPGTQLEKADAITMQVEEIVAAHPDLDRYSTRVNSSSSYITAYLIDKRKMSTADVVEEWRLATADILDCDVTISTSSYMSGSMSSDEVVVSIRGNDFDTLKEFSQEISDIMRAHPDIITVTSSLEDGNPQMDIVVDSVKASAYGLTPSQIATSVNNALSGVKAATITKDGRDYDVQVEYHQDKYNTMNDLENMILVLGAGRSVPLLDVASIEFTNAPQGIMKTDSQYSLSITGTPRKDAKFTAEADITQQINMLQFPSGVYQGRSTMQQQMDDMLWSIGQAILVAVLLVFMVMAIQFESIKHSLMVMICLPFSIIGAVAILALTGTTLNMTSLLGFLVLVGTVVNNGILFVDTTNQYRKDMDVRMALIRTGRHRLRPILMTTMTTVLSMVPMAMAWGTGSEMMQGMGLVVIGGLTASTLLTLLLLPTFYLIIDGNPEKRQRRKEMKEQKRQQKRQAANA